MCPTEPNVLSAPHPSRSTALRCVLPDRTVFDGEVRLISSYTSCRGEFDLQVIRVAHACAICCCRRPRTRATRATVYLKTSGRHVWTLRAPCHRMTSWPAGGVRVMPHGKRLHRRPAKLGRNHGRSLSRLSTQARCSIIIIVIGRYRRREMSRGNDGRCCSPHSSNTTPLHVIGSINDHFSRGVFACGKVDQCGRTELLLLRRQYKLCPTFRISQVHIRTHVL